MTKLPFRVTLLLALVLTFTAWNILRLWTSFVWRETLTQFSSAGAVYFSMISAALWSLAGFVFLWAFLQYKPWTGKFIILAAAACSAWYWMERLTLQNPRPNWQFAVIVNLVLFVFILFATKSLTREAYERESQNPEIE